MHQDRLPSCFGEKNLQEHQSGCVVEGGKKEEKTKAKAFMKVSYDLCGKIKTLVCLFIEDKYGYKVQNVIKVLTY
jgi:predicted protein tyrosine phosphatase